LRLTIRIKQFLLLGALIASLGALMLVLFGAINRSREAISGQEVQLRELEDWQTARSSFDALRYWYVDLANSLSSESEAAAAAAGAALAGTLERTASNAPDISNEIAALVDRIAGLSRDAVDEYAFEERAAGDALMGEARSAAVAADALFSEVIAERRDAASAAAREVAREARLVKLLAAIMIATLLALGLLLAYLSERLVFSPLNRITGAVRALARGRHDVDIPFAERHDEVGQMAGALRIFKENAVEAQQARDAMAAAQEREAAQTAHQREQTQRMIELLDSKVNAMLDNVGGSSQQLQSAAETMRAAAHKTDAICGQAAGASEDAAGQAENVLDTAGQMARSFNEMVAQIRTSFDLAREATEAAGSANETVGQLTDATEAIGEVSALIAGLAEQTNLLALNATIEAARAGDAGRGFAVVASEVKALAGQTARATGQIAERISQITEVSSHTAHAIERITGAIGNIRDISGQIGEAAQSQNALNEQIVGAVGQAAQRSGEVRDRMHTIAASASETGEVAGQVHGAAHRLSNLSQELRHTVDANLSQLRKSLRQRQPPPANAAASRQ